MFKIYVRIDCFTYAQYGTESYKDSNEAWEKAIALNELFGTNAYFVM